MTDMPQPQCNQDCAEPHCCIEPKLSGVQLSRLQSCAQDTKLVVQLHALRQVCQIRLCPLLFLQYALESEGAEALHSHCQNATSPTDLRGGGFACSECHR